MKRSTLIIVKAVAWIACLCPLADLLWGAVNNNLGPDPTAEIASVTGLTTLWMLAITLAISPVRKLSPQLAWLIKFRRLMGLFVFFYGTLHLLTWIALYNNFNVHAMLDDVTKRRFITMGVATWLLLLPLALTSTNWAIRKLGGKNWNRLHSLIYLAAICATIHYWWKVKTGVLSPAPFTVVLGLLLLVRPVMAWSKRRKARAVTV
ncbi:MAG TPA: protein-methionine-sulfoxide reductase heme-binding subunit MsrQ [Terracidiphilus sp.]|jgi:methionine sulfoxide reductase heme-binding subunit|nr:protein-methionine-sulfoxide reductase heme-binding subunit MsrQ [Terracidiphilus sp.]